MTARTAFRTVFALASIAALVSACGRGEIDIEEAQAQFCTDVEEYVTALDTYGGLFEDVELTVGDVQSAGEDLEPAREAVLDSAAQFQEAVEADPESAVEIVIVDPESIEIVEEAEAAFDDAVAGIDQRTLVTEAGVLFTSAAYQLQVAWARLFADAGCLDEEGLADATQWVSDYVSALQTDLATAGYYTGEIDGIYGPETIDAVERLQEDSGLPVTGLLDPASQAALGEVLGQQESAQVAALQGILTTTGHYGGPIDGVWSPEVEQALKELQTDLGVPATGVVDAATLRAFQTALVEAGAPPPPPPTTPATEAPGTTPPPPVTTSPAPTTTVPTATTTRPATTQPPPTVPVVEDNILDVLAAAGDFGQLLAAIDAAGLTETLSGPGPFTLFAPTDEAFAQLAEPLPSEPEALHAVLLYHVVDDDLSGFERGADRAGYGRHHLGRSGPDRPQRGIDDHNQQCGGQQWDRTCGQRGADSPRLTSS
jgi:peptidoglycan hydrolase-like protein with peptidoglycan-binding domain